MLPDDLNRNKKLGSMSSMELKELADMLADPNHTAAQRVAIIQKHLSPENFNGTLKYESHGGGMLSDNSSSFRSPPPLPKGQSGGDCFVVTATMGIADHPTVTLLRQFRDQCLVNSITGRFCIKVYYVVGPVMAAFIKKSILLRKLSYAVIVTPLEKIARSALRS